MNSDIILTVIARGLSLCSNPKAVWPQNQFPLSLVLGGNYLSDDGVVYKEENRGEGGPGTDGKPNSDKASEASRTSFFFSIFFFHWADCGSESIANMEVGEGEPMSFPFNAEELMAEHHIQNLIGLHLQGGHWWGLVVPPSVTALCPRVRLCLLLLK